MIANPEYGIENSEKKIVHFCASCHGKREQVVREMLLRLAKGWLTMTTLKTIVRSSIKEEKRGP